ncbi:MAG: urea carboxylase-associated family protein [Proteobacteria bacterium]|nr:urea carboxylase-associated family protein [Pseudomonadota bacterium]
MKPDKLLTRLHIDSQTGTAFTVKQGQTIRIIDVEGEQVSDLICFAQEDVEEYLSCGRTTDYNGKIYFSTGDVLYSDRSNPMLKIIADRVGKHIFLYAPCSPEMFQLTYDVTEPHPNCLDNLASSLEPFGIRPAQISMAFNVFMHITISEDGKISIHSPLSKAGDYIDLRAEMDLVVGVTSCSAGKCNNYQCTAIEVEIYDETHPNHKSR